MSLAEQLLADIQEGLQEGLAERAAADRAASEREQADQEALAKAKETASTSGLRPALEALDTASGGQLKITFNDNVNRLRIATEIPVARGGRAAKTNLSIYVEGNGEITAYGDHYHSKPTETVTSQGDAGPILKFIARKAAAKGLIPRP